MAKLPAITLTVEGAKIELAADSYKREGNLITVPSLGKVFACDEPDLTKKEATEAKKNDKEESGVKDTTGLNRLNRILKAHKTLANVHADEAIHQNTQGNRSATRKHAKLAMHHHNSYSQYHGGSHTPALSDKKMQMMNELKQKD